MGLLPTDVNLGDVFSALVNGIPQGITAAINDLEDPANYQVISSILDNPITNQLIGIAHTMGFTDATDLQSLLNIPSLLGGAQTALSSFDNFPISDATLLSSDLNLFTDQLEAGNLLGAVGDPIAADLALVPFAFGYGAAAPVLEAAAGTLINLVDLIPGL